MFRTIFPTTLLLALSLTAGCKKSKPASTLPPAITVTDADDADKDVGPPPKTSTEDATPAPQPQPQLTDVIYFEFDSSQLSQAGRDALAANAEWLQQDPTRKLLIEGHTDEVGTDEYNLALGERRARAAAEYLERMGIDADRIDVMTYGEERPASQLDSENRRAMFVSQQP